MKRLISFFVCLALAFPAPVLAQGNDNEYTPLGSRIRRDRQFPLDVADRFKQDQRDKVGRERSKAMIGQLAKCLYHRAGSEAVDLLDKTDMGFASFQQIGLQNDRALKIYGFSDCLGRVAEANDAGGVELRYTPGALRQWLLEEAYFDRFRDAPTWIKPGNVVAERVYPLSGSNRAVLAIMDFADCVVESDPYAADYFYRVRTGSAEGQNALNNLMPVLGPCLPQGQTIELTPVLLRNWLGEALWHAANHSMAPSAAPAKVDH